MDSAIKVQAALTEFQVQIQLLSQRCASLAGDLAETQSDLTAAKADVSRLTALLANAK